MDIWAPRSAEFESNVLLVLSFQKPNGFANPPLLRGAASMQTLTGVSPQTNPGNVQRISPQIARSLTSRLASPLLDVVARRCTGRVAKLWFPNKCEASAAGGESIVMTSTATKKGITHLTVMQKG